MSSLSKWRRECALGGYPSRVQTENWVYHPPGGAPPETFQVEVTIGKDLDILGLKGTDLSEVRDYAAFLSRTARQLYDDGAELRRIEHCPCCGTSTGDGAVQTYSFLEVPLHRCRTCGHGFVLNQPTSEALNAVFSESEAHSAIYVDRESLELRLEQIIAPKLDWVIKIFQTRYGSRPNTAVDVGAGGGHFVEALRRSGVDAHGYELSASSRRFASEAFGLELKNADFVADDENLVDLVAFWGLLEYTPQPRRFLEAARRRLDSGSGLLVVEVPRLDCLGTAAQASNAAQIARHMDPTSHVNTFTEESLATALVESGFSPIAIWYFGMDAYELLVQIALRQNDPGLMSEISDMIPAIQASLDNGRQCDDIVVAAVPTG